MNQLEITQSYVTFQSQTRLVQLAQQVATSRSKTKPAILQAIQVGTQIRLGLEALNYSAFLTKAAIDEILYLLSDIASINAFPFAPTVNAAQIPEILLGLPGPIGPAGPVGPTGGGFPFLVSNVSTDQVIDSFPITLCGAAEWTYDVHDATNKRVERLVGCWLPDGSQVRDDGGVTLDPEIGNTSGISFYVNFVAGNIQLIAHVTSGTWTIAGSRIQIPVNGNGVILPSSLTDGTIWIGSPANTPAEWAVTGDISLSNAGVASINPGVIVNADINASAAIDLTKLAAMAPSLAVVTNGSGFLTTSITTAAQIGFLSNVTSDVQAQINSKLTVNLGVVATGDILYFNGINWTNFARGSAGQVLSSTAGTIAWITASGGGITNSAAANELMKSDGTNAVPSGFFSTTLGNLILGTGLAGASRSITTEGTATDISVLLSSKGAGGAALATTNYGVVVNDNGNIAIGDRIFSNYVVFNGSTLSAAGGVNRDLSFVPLGNGNLSFFTNAGSFGSGAGVTFYKNAITNPSTAVAGGGVMFVKSTDGLPYWRTGSTESPMTGGGGGGASWLLASGGVLTGTNTLSGAFAVNFTNSRVTVTQPAQSAAQVTNFLTQPGAHTNLTAQYVANDFVGNTLTFSSGVTVDQRLNYFRGATYAQGGAASITRAYTVYIDPGIGGTLTPGSNYALGINGNLYLVSGQIDMGSSGNRITFQSANLTSFLLNNGNGYQFAYIGSNSPTAGTINLIDILGGTMLNSTTGSANFNAFRISGTLVPTGTTTGGTYAMIQNTPTYNFTVGVQTVYGFNYNPTLTGVVGLTHLAFRATSGAFLMGTTITNASAIMDIQSTTQAVIVPRMTTTQKNAIVTPTDGMQLYDSTLNKYQFRENGAWSAVGGTPAGANTQIQYNNAGAFGASSIFTLNVGTGKLDITADVFSHGGNFTIDNTSFSSIAFYALKVAGGGSWQVGSDGAGGGTGGNQYFVYDLNNPGDYNFTIQRGTGNVGILSSHPSHRLFVEQASPLIASSLLAVPQLLLRGFAGGSGNYWGGIGFAMNDHTVGKWGAGILGVDTTGAYGAGLGFLVSNGAATPVPTEAMRILPGGNVGIGTPSPAEKLQISNGQVRINNVGLIPSAVIRSMATNGDWEFGTNNGGNGTSNNQFYIYNYDDAIYGLTIQRGTANVGLGTNTPGERLTVAVGNLQVISYGGAGTRYIKTDNAGVFFASATLAITNLAPKTITTAVGLTLDVNSVTYIFTGVVVATFTLPAISGNTDEMFFVKNRGTASLTLQAAGIDNLFTTVVTPSIVLNPGDAFMLQNDGTYWIVM